MGDPFTNLQDGLRLAAELLARHPSSNQHIIVITDGQPTAYFSRGRLYCEWPLSFGGISMRAAQETLKEVERVTRRGITINTFMLDDSPSLRAFVERMTRINRGRALYTRPDRLGAVPARRLPQQEAQEDLTTASVPRGLDGASIDLTFPVAIVRRRRKGDSGMALFRFSPTSIP